MDITFILSAIIFTLLAIVVATSLLNNGSWYSFGQKADSPDISRHQYQNGHVSSPKRFNKNKTAEFDWCEMSGSSHDHWDVVKNVQSEDEVVSADPNTSKPSQSSLEVTPSLSSSSGRGSFMGLSESDLLKCAFSHPQTEGAAESPDCNDKGESYSNNCFKYLPGKSRSRHLQMMMSKDELEEEQRVQREQLAAIFQLLKDNKDTFGEVSEGDMDDQLKLYSI